MIDTFLLGSFIAMNSMILVFKGIYVNIEDKAKEDILKNGLYHITKPENAEKIMQDGYIRPSNTLLSLGRKKTFFFSGIPTVDLIRENVTNQTQQFEWTAINVNLDEQDLSNYKIRAFDDNSVTCIGKCELKENKVRKVELVLDLDKEGNPFIREKTQNEIENGYFPSDELKEKFKESNGPLALAKNGVISYVQMISRQLKRLGKHVGKKKLDNAISNSEEIKNKYSKDERNEFVKKLKVPESAKIINEGEKGTKEKDKVSNVNNDEIER